MQSYRNDPDGEENQAATKQNRREAFAAKNQQPTSTQTMTKHYHHTIDGSRIVISMSIEEFSLLCSTLSHTAGMLASEIEHYRIHNQPDYADYLQGLSNRLNKQCNLLENCPQAETIIDYTIAR